MLILLQIHNIQMRLSTLPTSGMLITFRLRLYVTEPPRMAYFTAFRLSARRENLTFSSQLRGVLTALRGGCPHFIHTLCGFHEHPCVLDATCAAPVCNLPCLSIRNNVPVEHCVAEACILHRNIERSIKTIIAR